MSSVDHTFSQMPRAFDVRLELQQVSPRVWRVIRVPDDLRLDDLHHAIQAVMGWEDFHPHVFEIGDQEYGPRPEPDDDDGDEPSGESSAWAGDDRALTIAQAFAMHPEGFTYIYDFDDDWRVTVTRVGEAEHDAAHGVVCLDGAESGPQQEIRDPLPFDVAQWNRRLARAHRPRATPSFPAGQRASADEQMLANVTLAALWLGSRPTRHGTREAWKHLRSEILDALHDAGLIETTADRKSVTLTDAGILHARRWLESRKT